MFVKKAILTALVMIIAGMNVVSYAEKNTGYGQDNTVDAIYVQSEEGTSGGFGSQNIELKQGEYKLPLTMMKGYDITSPSMAGSCIKGAVLYIDEAGSAKIKVNLGPVTIGPITDWAEQWKVYPELKTEGIPGNAEYTTNAEGNTDSITFDVPDNKWDGVYVNMFINAMNSSQDAYFAFDYANAESLGESEVKTYTGTSHIEQFGEYDVDVTVTVTDGKISSIDVVGKNFGGSYAEYNQKMFEKAKNGLKESYNGADTSDAKAVYEVDAVSGATYTSNAIRDAIMNALSLVYEEEVINLPSKPLEEGEYSVDIAFYTDIVEHSLVENDKIRARLDVNTDGKMTLTTDIINGTRKEPLYVTEFNGYYANNDRTSELKTDAEVVKSDIDYSDDVFKEGTKAVTRVSFPLEGEFSVIYNTNASIYVPAMSNLTGEEGGIVFDRGRFTADCFAKVYWDTLSQFEISADKVDTGSGTAYDIKLKNNTSQTKSADVICVLYKNGRIAGVYKSDEKSLSPYWETEVKAEFNESDYDTLKVFVWNNVNSMNPLFGGGAFTVSN